MCACCWGSWPACGDGPCTLCMTIAFFGLCAVERTRASCVHECKPDSNTSDQNQTLNPKNKITINNPAPNPNSTPESHTPQDKHNIQQPNSNLIPKSLRTSTNSHWTNTPRNGVTRTHGNKTHYWLNRPATNETTHPKQVTDNRELAKTDSGLAKSTKPDHPLTTGSGPCELHNLITCCQLPTTHPSLMPTTLHLNSQPPNSTKTPHSSRVQSWELHQSSPCGPCPSSPFAPGPTI